jgi:hypothetical protein
MTSNDESLSNDEKENFEGRRLEFDAYPNQEIREVKDNENLILANKNADTPETEQNWIDARAEGEDSDKRNIQHS